MANQTSLSLWYVELKKPDGKHRLATASEWPEPGKGKLALFTDENTPAKFARSCDLGDHEYEVLEIQRLEDLKLVVQRAMGQIGQDLGRFIVDPGSQHIDKWK